LIVQRIENSRHNNKSKDNSKDQNQYKNLFSFVILVENHDSVVANNYGRVGENTQI
jgi:hypothetical protein